MKGRISLKDFIHRVKDELVDAQDRSEDPFYELTEVTLEANFTLEATATTGFDLFVIDLSGEAKAQQSHKVTLKLIPLGAQRVTPVLSSATESGAAQGQSPKPPAGGDTTDEVAKESAKKSSGGGGGGNFGSRVLYDKIRD